MNQNTSSKKVLGFFDIVLMTITANFGIRWLAVAGGIGPSSLIFWLIGALIFFIPLSFICAQMSHICPEEGGLSTWVKRSLGEKSGFMVAWLYWVTNVFSYPAILIFLSSNFAYGIGHPELAQDNLFIISVVLISFWLTIILGLLGLKANKYLVSLGGLFGLLIPTVLLIIFSVIAYIKFGGSATKFNLASFVPGNKVVDNLSSLAMIMFAMAGVEVVPTFANSIKNAKYNLYLGLLVGSFIILLLYIGGTIAVNVLSTPDDIAKTSGVMQVFSIVDNKFNAAWFTRLMGILLSIAELAAGLVWLIAPVIMFFKCTPRGILPNFLHKVDENGTPINAILFQGVLVSIIMLFTGFLPTVNTMYQILVLMATVLYFIPYIYLVCAYIKSAKQLKLSKPFVNIFGGVTLIAVLFGIAVSFVPSSDLKTAKDIIHYEIELVCGPLIFLIFGWLLYGFRKN